MDLGSKVRILNGRDSIRDVHGQINDHHQSYPEMVYTSDLDRRLVSNGPTPFFLPAKARGGAAPRQPRRSLTISAIYRRTCGRQHRAIKPNRTKLRYATHMVNQWK